MIVFVALTTITWLIAIATAFPNGSGTCDLTPDAIKMNRPQRVKKRTEKKKKKNPKRKKINTTISSL
jgi:hypothetical protein